MRRLPATDSLFLSLESGAFAMQVGALILLDTSEAPEFSFERVRDGYRRRIARVQKFTWRLREVPFGLDRPSWTDDADFDVDRHLSRVTVPAPGGPREVAEVVGELFEQRLERDRPLWRAWYLDGLPEGTAALFSVNHHCLMDGTSGASIASILFDTEPDEDPGPAEPIVGPGGREPSGAEHLLRSVGNLAVLPTRAPGFLAAVARRVTQVLPDVTRNGVPAALRAPAPRTSFNEAIGDRRRIAFVTLPLEQAKAVRRATGATVNDVIVAVCTGAIERYLETVGEGLPDRPFTVFVPVSMRSASDDGELTNRVAAFPISVAHGITDPVERLRAISRETEREKQLTGRFAGNRLPSVAELVPPFALGTFARAFAPFIPRVPVIGNTMVSTIRGAPFPLYLAGARIVGMFPTNMLMGNMGLDFTTISSEDRIDVGVTVDPDLVPDPWLVADALPQALEELVRAAHREHVPSTPESRSGSADGHRPG